MKEDNRKPWSIEATVGEQRWCLAHQACQGWLMLSPPLLLLSLNLNEGYRVPGRITGPHLRWGVTRLAVLWGFASRSENESRAPLWGGCPRARTPGRREAGGYRCTLQLLREPARPPHACCVCLAGKGAVWGTERTHSQKSVALRDPGFTQLGHAIHLSHSIIPTGVTAPCPCRLQCPHGFERQRHLLLPSVVLLQDHPKVFKEEFKSALWDGQPWPGVLQLCGGSRQRRRAELYVAPEPQPWASSHLGPHVRKM